MLNPALNRPALLREFKQQGRILVPDVFQAEEADRIHRCLTEETPWDIAFVDDQGKGVSYTPEEWRAFPPAERQRLVAGVQKRAETEFQFVYNKLSILRHYEQGTHPQLYYHQLIETLCSWDFIQFARDITGDTEINRVDAQAARYVAGQYLKQHNDLSNHEDRRYAYVLNFTRDWKSDWGGLLHFFDDHDNVTATYKPGYNTLMLFKVPVTHSVSYVAPFATGQRVTIVGWFTVR